MNSIFSFQPTALDSHRVFDRFGFNLPKTTIERTPARAVINHQEWTFEPTSTDWTNTQTGETLRVIRLRFNWNIY